MQRQIELTREVRASAADAASVLAGATAAVVGAERPSDGQPGSYRVALHVNGRNGSVQHDAKVTLHRADGTKEAHAWEIAISPRGASRVLPTFAGRLTIGERDATAALVLSGTYRPPLGKVGAFGDGLVGHRLVRQSLEYFVAELAGRIEAEVNRLAPAAGRPAPYPPDLRPDRPAEYWLG